MGLFDSFRQRQVVNLDSPGAVARRNAIATAVEVARKPIQPTSSRNSLHRVGATAARMMFASADVGRLTGDWPTNPVPADWVISRYQRTLVARSREQAHNNDFMKAYLRLNRLNVVGPKGITFHSQVVTGSGKPDMSVRRAIERWFTKWGHRSHCDVAGKLSWRAMQAACVEGAARDGEFFVRLIFGRDGGLYGCALQFIDPQRCPVEMDRSDLADGAFIRQGIEFNRYGRPVAYYFADQSAERNSQSYTYSGRAYVRVPADEVIHGFIAELPGQKRGLPWMATGLFRAKQASAMEDAAVVNARMGAAKMGFIQFKEGAEGPEYDPDEGLEIDAEPGAFPVLPTGAELKDFSPQYPQGEFAPFIKQLLRGFSAGGGVAYHSISQDLENVNFSSIRHGTLDERETYKERQEWLREELCDRVFEAAFTRALLGGHVVTDKGRTLRADRIDDYMERKWQPRRWQWIDPRADVEATETSKNNLLSSPSELIREQGKDPHEVWAEIGADVEAMRAAGIPDVVIAASWGQKPAPTPAPAVEQKGNPKE